MVIFQAIGTALTATIVGSVPWSTVAGRPRNRVSGFSVF